MVAARAASAIDPSSVRSLTADEHRRVAACRLRAVDAAPYLASLLLSMPVYAVDGITASVDRSARLYLGMEFFSALTPDEAVGLLLHEVRHVLAGHDKRAQRLGVLDDDRQRWNVAADLTINDELVEGGFALPAGAVLCAHHGVEPGRSAEVYFDELDRGSGEESLSCGSGAGGSPSPWELPDEPDTVDAAASRGTGSDSADDDPSSDDASAGGDGESAEQGDDTSAPGNTGDRVDLDGVDSDANFGRGMRQLEIELARRHVAQEIEAHMSRHGVGSVPAGLRAWSESQLGASTVSWREVLRTAVRRPLRYASGVDDYSWARPNRRRQSGAILLPTTVSPTPTVAVVVDVSGSINEASTRGFVSELMAMTSQFRVRPRDVPVIPCDGEAHPALPADRVLAQAALPRGGGTDMGAGIDAAQKLRPRPDLIVVFTDGRTPWPNDPPAVPVVIVISEGGTQRGTPDWATVTEID